MMRSLATPVSGPENPKSLKIIFLVAEDWYFLSHRLSLARACRDLGWDVVVATHVDRHGDAIRREGFRLIPIRMVRRSRHLIHELGTIKELTLIYAREKPDIVHQIGLKPVIYGSLASMVGHAGLVVNALAGMGYIFTSGSTSIRLARQIIKLLLWVSFRPRRHRLILQNRHDAALFAVGGICRVNQTQIIRGSGVDLEKFVPSIEPGGMIIVALVSRMLKDKGVCETVLAARELKRRGSKTQIWLVGAPDADNPSSLSEEALCRWHKEGCVDWLGYQDDVKAVWSKAHIAILPSYREGMPMALLEAAASGRPMITTDVPGCNELVEDGVNGLLVPANDWLKLADSIEILSQSAGMRARLGAAARKKVEVGYGLKETVNQTLAVYRKGMDEMGVETDIGRNPKRS
jgi:glycosyltransferase involved in cell wall biosynthesis